MKIVKVTLEYGVIRVVVGVKIKGGVNLSTVYGTT